MPPPTGASCSLDGTGRGGAAGGRRCPMSNNTRCGISEASASAAKEAPPSVCRVSQRYDRPGGCSFMPPGPFPKSWDNNSS